MRITAEEKLMYGVMKAVYDSGIPISFKGSMVLKACLLEFGYSEETRHTVDIDANWNANPLPTGEQMAESLEKALRQSGIDLSVRLYRMYGEKRSAGFEMTDKTTGEILFTMDADINRPVPPTKIYEVEGFRFRGVMPSQMIADKLAVISTKRVFQRVKDMIDLFYLSKVFPFDREELRQTLTNSNRRLGDFADFLHSVDALRHAYEKFRFDGDVSKPSFEEVYMGVKAYMQDELQTDGSNI